MHCDLKKTWTSEQLLTFIHNLLKCSFVKRFFFPFYYFLSSITYAYIWQVNKKKCDVNLSIQDKLTVQAVQVLMEEINLDCFN